MNDASIDADFDLNEIVDVPVMIVRDPERERERERKYVNESLV